MDNRCLFCIFILPYPHGSDDGIRKNEKFRLLDYSAKLWKSEQEYIKFSAKYLTNITGFPPCLFWRLLYPVNTEWRYLT